MLNIDASPIIYSGARFANTEHLAKFLGVDETLMRFSIKRGYALNQELVANLKRSFRVFGKLYRSKLELCRYFEIEESDLDYYSRGKGFTLAQAVVHAQLARVKFRGKPYDSVYDLCFSVGVHPQAVLSRMHMGQKLSSVVTREIGHKRNSRQVTYRGKDYKSLASLCATYGISYNFVSNRAFRKGVDFLDMFDAINTVLSQYEKGKPTTATAIPFIIYQGIWYTSLGDFLAMMGTSTAELITIQKPPYAKTLIQTLNMMATETKAEYYVVATGLIMTRTDIRRKYRVSAEDMIERGVIEKRQVKKYPHFKFDPTIPLYTPKYDFDAYMERMEGSKTNKVG